MDLDLRHIAEARHQVRVEARVVHLAAVESHFLAERRAQTHDDAPLHLRHQVVWIEDRAALEDLAHASHHDPLLLPVQRDFDAGRHVGALFSAARQAHAHPGLPLLHALGPLEPAGGLFEHRAEARIVEVRQAEVQRVAARQGGQLVHEALPGEIVGRGRQRAIRPLAQRRIGGHVAAARLAGAVRRVHRRSAGVDVQEMPARQRALLIQAGLDVDRRGRAEIGPRELLLARPSQRDGAPGGAGQARRLDGRLPSMLAAETAAEIRHHHADLLIGQAEGAGELAVVAERILRPRPHGQRPVAPLRHRRAGLQRGVLHVGHVVGLPQHAVRPGQLVGKRVLGHAAAGMRAQVVEHLLARRVRSRLPPGRPGDRLQRLPGAMRGGRGHAHELAIAHDDNVLHGLGGLDVDRRQLRAVGGRAQNLAVQHSGQRHVRRELVRAGHQVAPVRTRN